jgi:hypothetical protein
MQETDLVNYGSYELSAELISRISEALGPLGVSAVKKKRKAAVADDGTEVTSDEAITTAAKGTVKKKPYLVDSKWNDLGDIYGGIVDVHMEIGSSDDILAGGCPLFATEPVATVPPAQDSRIPMPTGALPTCLPPVPAARDCSGFDAYQTSISGMESYNEYGSDDDSGDEVRRPVTTTQKGGGLQLSAKQPRSAASNRAARRAAARESSGSTK